MIAHVVFDLPPDHPFFQGAHYVFHFAGIGDIVPSIERPLDYLSANVMGTVCALEAARRCHETVSQLAA